LSQLYIIIIYMHFQSSAGLCFLGSENIYTDALWLKGINKKLKDRNNMQRKALLLENGLNVELYLTRIMIQIKK